MKVKLREIERANSISQVIEYYEGGKRQYENLQLPLHKEPSNAKERQENKELRKKAEAICTLKKAEIINGQHGLKDLNLQKGSFIEFVSNLTAEKTESKGNNGNWKSMLKHLKLYTISDISFKQVDTEYVKGFKAYLDKEAIKKDGNSLSSNTKASYFVKFKSALNYAIKLGIITQNPCSGVKSFKENDVEREFLTKAELKLLAKTECNIPTLKNAFLLSCATGLRWSDIIKLKWTDITPSPTGGYNLRYKMQKTKIQQTLPIPEKVYISLKKQERTSELIFGSIKYSVWLNKKLQEWITTAGVDKKITYHISRHTFAIAKLEDGTDIYTLSKLMGHTSIKTTAIYAKILDYKKTEAMNRIVVEW